MKTRGRTVDSDEEAPHVRRAALYLRRSTNEELQTDSLDYQDEILRKFAEREKLEVDDRNVFRESASGRDADGRTEFIRLIDIVTSGAADFEVILVRDVSRWGRFDNIDESAYYDFLCFRHGVQVVYVEEAFAADSSPMSFLMKSMKRLLAAEYSREKSRIVSHGKRRTAERGFRSGAPPPYGMKRIMVRPDGAYVQDLPPGVHKAVSCYKTKLAPATDGTAVIVQKIFRLFVDRKLTMNSIAEALNRARVPGPRGGRWYQGVIRFILENSTYVGDATHHPASGDQTEIRVKSAYAPLLDLPLFEAAQRRLADIAQGPRRSRQAVITEAREAYRRWGHLPADVIREVSQSRFPTTKEANEAAQLIDEIFVDRIAEEKSRLAAILSLHSPSRTSVPRSSSTTL